MGTDKIKKPGKNVKALKLDYHKTEKTGLSLLKGNYFENKVGLFILIGLQTGLRSTDILNLKKTDFEARENGAELMFKAKKTKKEGVLFVGKTVYDEIVKCDNEYIFYNNVNKNRFTHTWINRRLKDLFEKEYLRASSKGKTIGVHSLRKTAGVYIYENFGLETARKFLQHRSYDTTKIYLEIDNDELVNKLQSLYK